MKLMHSPTSPYARKAYACALALGFESRVELVPTNPHASPDELLAQNPLSKIPCLITDEGESVFDSRVIVEYQDSLGAGPSVFPAAGPERWAALRLQAIGDGICDAAMLRRLENARPEGEKSAAWMERQRVAVVRSLDLLEREAGALGDGATIGTLAILTALGYLDFRFAHEPWREGRPALTAWFARMADRDSFRRSAPPVG